MARSEAESENTKPTDGTDAAGRGLVVDRLTGADESATPRRRGPAIVAPAVREWDCTVPNDPTIPLRRVPGLTAGDAEFEFKRRLGIISCGHPIQVIPAG